MTESGSEDRRATVEAHRLDPELDRIKGELERRLFGLRPAPTRIGRHVLLDQAGAGGMGVVYAAYDPELDRKVAIKLLRPDRGSRHTDSVGRARLLREAQALARLTHQNIISVFDTGTHEDQVFLVMEFVEGSNLRAWAKETVRSTAEVLEHYVAAGRGLAAAHVADVIHRDFKPENVLVGPDGRVLVVDFGLARAAGAISSSGAPESDDALIADDRISLGSVLTEAGTVLGTPTYMAPEQRRGASGPASDQFSFCIALYEALYGELPFKARTLSERADAIESGEFRPAPAGAHVAPRIRRALLRGMAALPEGRFETMDALLAELEPPPAQAKTRRVAIAAVSVAVLVSGVAASAWIGGASSAAPDCDTGEARLAGVWDPQRKASVADKFGASASPYAAQTWERVAPTLDGYADAWAQMHRDACEATWVRREQPESILGLRMLCLDVRRHALQTLVGRLEVADGRVVRTAVDAAAGLSPVEQCADVQRIGAELGEATDTGQRDAVAELRKRVAELRVLRQTGGIKEPLTIMRELVEDAKEVGHVPTLADASVLLGDILRLKVIRHGGAPEEAKPVLLEAARLAREAGLVEREIEAMADLVTVLAPEGADPGAALIVADLAEQAAEGKEVRNLVLADLYNSRAIVLADAGQRIAAQEDLEQSLALKEQSLDADDPRLATALGNLAIVLRLQGHYETSRAHLERALEIKTAAYGPDHPEVALTLSNLGTAYTQVGRDDDAIEVLGRVHSIYTATHGADDPQTAVCLHNLGRAYIAKGMPELALPMQQEALRLLRKAYGEAHPNITMSLGGIASTLEESGDLDGALRYLEEATANYRAQAHKRPRRLTGLMIQRGVLLRRMGRLGEAKIALREGVELARAAGEDDVGEAMGLIGLGDVALGTKQPEVAMAHAEAALALLPGAVWPHVRFAALVTLTEAIRSTDPEREPALMAELAARVPNLVGPKAKRLRERYARLTTSKKAN